MHADLLLGHLLNDQYELLFVDKLIAKLQEEMCLLVNLNLHIEPRRPIKNCSSHFAIMMLKKSIPFLGILICHFCCSKKSLVTSHYPAPYRVE